MGLAMLIQGRDTRLRAHHSDLRRPQDDAANLMRQAV